MFLCGASRKKKKKRTPNKVRPDLAPLTPPRSSVSSRSTSRSSLHRGEDLKQVQDDLQQAEDARSELEEQLWKLQEQRQHAAEENRRVQDHFWREKEQTQLEQQKLAQQQHQRLLSKARSLGSQEFSAQALPLTGEHGSQTESLTGAGALLLESHASTLLGASSVHSLPTQFDPDLHHRQQQLQEIFLIQSEKIELQKRKFREEDDKFRSEEHKVRDQFQQHSDWVKKLEERENVIIAYIDDNSPDDTQESMRISPVGDSGSDESVKGIRYLQSTKGHTRAQSEPGVQYRLHKKIKSKDTAPLPSKPSIETFRKAGSPVQRPVSCGGAIDPGGTGPTAAKYQTSAAAAEVTARLYTTPKNKPRSPPVKTEQEHKGARPKDSTRGRPLQQANHSRSRSAPILGRGGGVPKNRRTRSQEQQLRALSPGLRTSSSSLASVPESVEEMEVDQGELDQDHESGVKRSLSGPAGSLPDVTVRVDAERMDFPFEKVGISKNISQDRTGDGQCEVNVTTEGHLIQEQIIQTSPVFVAVGQKPVTDLTAMDTSDGVDDGTGGTSDNVDICDTSNEIVPVNAQSEPDKPRETPVREIQQDPNSSQETVIYTPRDSSRMVVDPASESEGLSPKPEGASPCDPTQRALQPGTTRPRDTLHTRAGGTTVPAGLMRKLIVEQVVEVVTEHTDEDEILSAGPDRKRSRSPDGSEVVPEPSSSPKPVHKPHKPRSSPQLRARSHSHPKYPASPKLPSPRKKPKQDDIPVEIYLNDSSDLAKQGGTKEPPPPGMEEVFTFTKTLPVGKASITELIDGTKIIRRIRPSYAEEEAEAIRQHRSKKGRPIDQYFVIRKHRDGRTESSQDGDGQRPSTETKNLEQHELPAYTHDATHGEQSPSPAQIPLRFSSTDQEPSYFLNATYPPSTQPPFSSRDSGIATATQVSSRTLDSELTSGKVDESGEFYSDDSLESEKAEDSPTHRPNSVMEEYAKVLTAKLQHEEGGYSEDSLNEDSSIHQDSLDGRSGKEDISDSCDRELKPVTVSRSQEAVKVTSRDSSSRVSSGGDKCRGVTSQDQATSSSPTEPVLAVSTDDKVTQTKPEEPVIEASSQRQNLTESVIPSPRRPHRHRHRRRPVPAGTDSDVAGPHSDDSLTAGSHRSSSRPGSSKRRRKQPRNLDDSKRSRSQSSEEYISSESDSSYSEDSLAQSEDKEGLMTDMDTAELTPQARNELSKVTSSLSALTEALQTRSEPEVTDTGDVLHEPQDQNVIVQPKQACDDKSAENLDVVMDTSAGDVDSQSNAPSSTDIVICDDPKEEKVDLINQENSESPKQIPQVTDAAHSYNDKRHLVMTPIDSWNTELSVLSDDDTVDGDINLLPAHSSEHKLECPSVVTSGVFCSTPKHTDAGTLTADCVHSWHSAKVQQEQYDVDNMDTCQDHDVIRDDANSGLDTDVIRDDANSGLNINVIRDDANIGSDTDVIRVDANSGLDTDVIRDGANGGLNINVIRDDANIGLETDVICDDANSRLDIDVIRDDANSGLDTDEIRYDANINSETDVIRDDANIGSETDVIHDNVKSGTEADYIPDDVSSGTLVGLTCDSAGKGQHATVTSDVYPDNKNQNLSVRDSDQLSCDNVDDIVEMDQTTENKLHQTGEAESVQNTDDPPARLTGTETHDTDIPCRESAVNSSAPDSHSSYQVTLDRSSHAPLSSSNPGPNADCELDLNENSLTFDIEMDQSQPGSSAENNVKLSQCEGESPLCIGEPANIVTFGLSSWPVSGEGLPECSINNQELFVDKPDFDPRVCSGHETSSSDLPNENRKNETYQIKVPVGKGNAGKISTQELTGDNTEVTSVCLDQGNESVQTTNTQATGMDDIMQTAMESQSVSGYFHQMASPAWSEPGVSEDTDQDRPRQAVPPSVCVPSTGSGPATLESIDQCMNDSLNRDSPPTIEDPGQIQTSNAKEQIPVCGTCDQPLVVDSFSKLNVIPVGAPVEQGGEPPRAGEHEAKEQPPETVQVSDLTSIIQDTTPEQAVTGYIDELVLGQSEPGAQAVCVDNVVPGLIPNIDNALTPEHRATSSPARPSDMADSENSELSASLRSNEDEGYSTMLLSQPVEPSESEQSDSSAATVMENRSWSLRAGGDGAAAADSCGDELSPAVSDTALQHASGLASPTVSDEPLKLASLSSSIDDVTGSQVSLQSYKQTFSFYDHEPEQEHDSALEDHQESHSTPPSSPPGTPTNLNPSFQERLGLPSSPEGRVVVHSSQGDLTYSDLYVQGSHDHINMLYPPEVGASPGTDQGHYELVHFKAPEPKRRKKRVKPLSERFDKMKDLVTSEVVEVDLNDIVAASDMTWDQVEQVQAQEMMIERLEQELASQAAVNSTGVDDDQVVPLENTNRMEGIKTYSEQGVVNEMNANGENILPNAAHSQSHMAPSQHSNMSKPEKLDSLPQEQTMDIVISEQMPKHDYDKDSESARSVNDGDIQYGQPGLHDIEYSIDQGNVILHTSGMQSTGLDQEYYQGQITHQQTVSPSISAFENFEARIAEMEREKDMLIFGVHPESSYQPELSSSDSVDSYHQRSSSSYHKPVSKTQSLPSLASQQVVEIEDLDSPVLIQSESTEAILESVRPEDIEHVNEAEGPLGTSTDGDSVDNVISSDLPTVSDMPVRKSVDASAEAKPSDFVDNKEEQNQEMCDESEATDISTSDKRPKDASVCDSAFGSDSTDVESSTMSPRVSKSRDIVGIPIQKAVIPESQSLVGEVVLQHVETPQAMQVHAGMDLPKHLSANKKPGELACSDSGNESDAGRLSELTSPEESMRGIHFSGPTAESMTPQQLETGPTTDDVADTGEQHRHPADTGYVSNEQSTAGILEGSEQQQDQLSDTDPTNQTSDEVSEQSDGADGSTQAPVFFDTQIVEFCVPSGPAAQPTSEMPPPPDQHQLVIGSEVRSNYSVDEVTLNTDVHVVGLQPVPGMSNNNIPPSKASWQDELGESSLHIEIKPWRQQAAAAATPATEVEDVQMTDQAESHEAEEKVSNGSKVHVSNNIEITREDLPKDSADHLCQGKPSCDELDTSVPADIITEETVTLETVMTKTDYKKARTDQLTAAEETTGEALTDDERLMQIKPTMVEAGGKQWPQWLSVELVKQAEKMFRQSEEDLHSDSLSTGSVEISESKDEADGHVCGQDDGTPVLSPREPADSDEEEQNRRTKGRGSKDSSVSRYSGMILPGAETIDVHSLNATMSASEADILGSKEDMFRSLAASYEDIPSDEKAQMSASDNNLAGHVFSQGRSGVPQLLIADQGELQDQNEQDLAEIMSSDGEEESPLMQVLQRRPSAASLCVGSLSPGPAALVIQMDQQVGGIDDCRELQQQIADLPDIVADGVAESRENWLKKPPALQKSLSMSEIEISDLDDLAERRALSADCVWQVEDECMNAVSTDSITYVFMSRAQSREKELDRDAVAKSRRKHKSFPMAAADDDSCQPGIVPLDRTYSAEALNSPRSARPVLDTSASAEELYVPNGQQPREWGDASDYSIFAPSTGSDSVFSSRTASPPKSRSSEPRDIGHEKRSTDSLLDDDRKNKRAISDTPEKAKKSVSWSDVSRIDEGRKTLDRLPSKSQNDKLNSELVPPTIEEIQEDPNSPKLQRRRLADQNAEETGGSRSRSLSPFIKIDMSDEPIKKKKKVASRKRERSRSWNSLEYLDLSHSWDEIPQISKKSKMKEVAIQTDAIEEEKPNDSILDMETQTDLLPAETQQDPTTESYQDLQESDTFVYSQVGSEKEKGSDSDSQLDASAEMSQTDLHELLAKALQTVKQSFDGNGDLCLPQTVVPACEDGKVKVVADTDTEAAGDTIKQVIDFSPVHADASKDVNMEGNTTQESKEESVDKVNQFSSSRSVSTEPESSGMVALSVSESGEIACEIKPYNFTFIQLPREQRISIEETKAVPGAENQESVTERIEPALVQEQALAKSHTPVESQPVSAGQSVVQSQPDSTVDQITQSPSTDTVTPTVGSLLNPTVNRTVESHATATVHPGVQLHSVNEISGSLEPQPMSALSSSVESQSVTGIPFTTDPTLVNTTNQATELKPIAAEDITNGSGSIDDIRCIEDSQSASTVAQSVESQLVNAVYQTIDSQPSAEAGELLDQNDEETNNTVALSNKENLALQDFAESAKTRQISEPTDNYNIIQEEEIIPVRSQDKKFVLDREPQSAQPSENDIGILKDEIINQTDSVDREQDTKLRESVQDEMGPRGSSQDFEKPDELDGILADQQQIPGDSVPNYKESYEMAKHGPIKESYEVPEHGPTRESYEVPEQGPTRESYEVPEHDTTRESYEVPEHDTTRESYEVSEHIPTRESYDMTEHSPTRESYDMTEHSPTRESYDITEHSPTRERAVQTDFMEPFLLAKAQSVPNLPDGRPSSTTCTLGGSAATSFSDAEFIHSDIQPLIERPVDELQVWKSDIDLSTPFSPVYSEDITIQTIPASSSFTDMMAEDTSMTGPHQRTIETQTYPAVRGIETQTSQFMRVIETQTMENDTSENSSPFSSLQYTRHAEPSQPVSNKIDTAVSPIGSSIEDLIQEMRDAGIDTREAGELDLSDLSDGEAVLVLDDLNISSPEVTPRTKQDQDPSEIHVKDKRSINIPDGVEYDTSIPEYNIKDLDLDGLRREHEKLLELLRNSKEDRKEGLARRMQLLNERIEQVESNLSKETDTADKDSSMVNHEPTTDNIQDGRQEGLDNNRADTQEYSDVQARVEQQLISSKMANLLSTTTENLDVCKPGKAQTEQDTTPNQDADQSEYVQNTTDDADILPAEEVPSSAHIVGAIELYTPRDPSQAQQSQAALLTEIEQSPTLNMYITDEVQQSTSPDISVDDSRSVEVILSGADTSNIRGTPDDTAIKAETDASGALLSPPIQFRETSETVPYAASLYSTQITEQLMEGILVEKLQALEVDVTSRLAEAGSGTDTASFGTDMKDEAIETDFSTSDMSEELERLLKEKERIQGMLGKDMIPSKLQVELAEAQLNYYIGQTDTLLQTLDQPWTEDVQSQLQHLAKPAEHELAAISQKYLAKYKAALEESEKKIEERIKEIEQQRQKENRSREKVRSLARYRQQAAINSFKLEREREQLDYQRMKELPRPSSKSPPRATVEPEVPLSPRDSESDFGIPNAPLFAKYLTPKQRKVYLARLRKGLINSTKKSRSQSGSPPRATLSPPGSHRGSRSVSPAVSQEQLLIGNPNQWPPGVGGPGSIGRAGMYEPLGPGDPRSNYRSMDGLHRTDWGLYDGLGPAYRPGYAHSDIPQLHINTDTRSYMESDGYSYVSSLEDDSEKLLRETEDARNQVRRDISRAHDSLNSKPSPRGQLTSPRATSSPRPGYHRIGGSYMLHSADPYYRLDPERERMERAIDREIDRMRRNLPASRLANIGSDSKYQFRTVDPNTGCSIPFRGTPLEPPSDSSPHRLAPPTISSRRPPLQSSRYQPSSASYSTHQRYQDDLPIRRGKFASSLREAKLDLQPIPPPNPIPPQLSNITHSRVPPPRSNTTHITHTPGAGGYTTQSPHTPGAGSYTTPSSHTPSASGYIPPRTHSRPSYVSGRY